MKKEKKGRCKIKEGILLFRKTREEYISKTWEEK